MIPLLLIEKAVEYLLIHHLDDAVDLGKEIMDHIAEHGETPNDGAN